MTTISKVNGQNYSANYPVAAALRARYPNEDLAIIHYYRDGTYLSKELEWRPDFGQAGVGPWQRDLVDSGLFVATARAQIENSTGKETVISGVVWIQGEWDARDDPADPNTEYRNAPGINGVTIAGVSRTYDVLLDKLIENVRFGDAMNNPDGFHQIPFVIPTLSSNIDFVNIGGRTIDAMGSPSELEQFQSLQWNLHDPSNGKIVVDTDFVLNNAGLTTKQDIFVHEDFFGQNFYVHFNAAGMDTVGMAAGDDLRLPGDFDGSGYSVDDIQHLIDTQNDLNGSGIYDVDDVELLLDYIGRTNGDLDDNGAVEFADFLILYSNFGNSGDWEDGDLNGNGTVDFPDYLIFQSNFP